MVPVQGRQFQGGYTGYTVDGSEILHQVGGSWNPIIYQVF